VHRFQKVRKSFGHISLSGIDESHRPVAKLSCFDFPLPDQQDVFMSWIDGDPLEDFSDGSFGTFQHLEE
jgi:hypothetical protein